MLAGCGTMNPTRTTVINSAPLCQGIKIVRFSRKHDTPETVAQNEDNNAAWRAACEPKTATK